MTREYCVRVSSAARERESLMYHVKRPNRTIPRFPTPNEQICIFFVTTPISMYR